MAKTYMFYKVKFQGNTIAQFATANLAAHFVGTLSNNDFIINYNNSTNVWNTAKEGTPVVDVIEKRGEKFCAEQDARFNEKWDAFKQATSAK